MILQHILLQNTIDNNNSKKDNTLVVSINDNPKNVLDVYYAFSDFLNFSQNIELFTPCFTDSQITIDHMLILTKSMQGRVPTQ